MFDEQGTDAFSEGVQENAVSYAIVVLLTVILLAGIVMTLRVAPTLPPVIPTLATQEAGQ